MKDGENSGCSSRAYIIDKEYAQSPIHFIQAFLIIQKDLKTLFEYIEPSDNNAGTYSFRVHELFMRTCIEIEANFKAVLEENIYTPPKQRNMNMIDYYIIEKTHRLSGYKVLLPIWDEGEKLLQPFVSWKTITTKPPITINTVLNVYSI